MTRRILTAAAVALATLGGAAMGREAARCIQIEREHRARRRQPQQDKEQGHSTWIQTESIRQSGYECIGPSGCGAARTEAP